MSTSTLKAPEKIQTTEGRRMKRRLAIWLTDDEIAWLEKRAAARNWKDHTADDELLMIAGTALYELRKSGR